MKKAAYVFSIVLYPFLILAIAAGCLQNYIYQVDIRDICRNGLLLFVAFCLLGIHYLLFTCMAKKCNLEPLVHLLCCTYLLGIDAAPFLYIIILCREVPVIVALQVILLSTRIFYTHRQVRHYRKSIRSENT